MQKTKGLRVWAILPEGTLTEDRAYLLGYLRSAFGEIETSRVALTGDRVDPPKHRPDLVLNLVPVKNVALLEDLDRHVERYRVPISPPTNGSRRAEDKRTYIRDYGDVIPPTRIVHTLDQVEQAWRDYGRDLVVKDPLGRAGVGVERIRDERDFPIASRLLETTIMGTGELVAQPYLSGFSKGDKRIIAQRFPDGSFGIIAFIGRRPPRHGWKSNVSLGGSIFLPEITDEEAELALRLAPRANLDNIAYDIGAHDGRLYYIEHNAGYGGIIDFDLGHGALSVRHCVAFLAHLAREGRTERTTGSFNLDLAKA